MTKSELQKILRSEYIRQDAYDLDGGHRTETYTLGEAQGRWFVYYSERGLESGRKDFATESEACEYFLNWLRRDPTVRS
jgi:hypothetical protein